MGGMTARYDPAVWDALEALAAERLAQAGTDIAAIRRSLESVRGGRTEQEMDEAAVRTAISIGGPPASDDDMRQFAHSLGYVLDTDAAPAEIRRAS